MFKYKFILAFIFVSLIIFTPHSIAQENNSDVLMQQGEYLEYEVSFFGVKLGSIKMFIDNKEKVNSVLAYKVHCLIKSYEKIPFVDLDAKFESWIDPSVSFSQKFISNSKKSDKTWAFQQLDFDYPNKKYTFRMWHEKKLEEETVIQTPRRWNDGSSLFFLARRFLNFKKTIKIPTIIDKDTCFTTINFRGKRESIKIDAINYPVRTVYFDGIADWEGLYGLKGNFEGWFSDDEAAVPIVAKMNVYVGKVNIELKKWTRAGWTPPR